MTSPVLCVEAKARRQQAQNEPAEMRPGQRLPCPKVGSCNVHRLPVSCAHMEGLLCHKTWLLCLNIVSPLKWAWFHFQDQDTKKQPPFSIRCPASTAGLTQCREQQAVSTGTRRAFKGMRNWGKLKLATHIFSTLMWNWIQELVVKGCH